MRMCVSYFEDHGWYVGRPLRWLGLLALGGVTLVAGFVCLLVVGIALQKDLPFEFAGPIIMAVLAAREISRIRSGARIHFVPLRASWMKRLRMTFSQRHEDDWAPLETITAESEPELFRRFVMIEAVMWLSVIGLQLGTVIVLTH